MFCSHLDDGSVAARYSRAVRKFRLNCTQNWADRLDAPVLPENVRVSVSRTHMSMPHIVGEATQRLLSCRDDRFAFCSYLDQIMKRFYIEIR